MLVGALAGAPAADARPLKKSTWVKGVSVTEYFPAPEKWSSSRFVIAPGLVGRHRADWLYSAKGIAMEGDGIGLDGHWYHIESVGAGWINATGRLTVPGRRGWTRGSPAWLIGTYWLNRGGRRTYPRYGGHWTNGYGIRFHPPAGVSFGNGPSKPLTYYHSIAVDPRLIPLGSKVFLPAYRWTRFKGWFIAADTGGAIKGRHVDVFRSVPTGPAGAQSRSDQRMYVVPSKR